MDLLDGHETTNVQLTFNKDFAKRLRHNKQREELDRLQQKYGKDLDAAKPEKVARSSEFPDEESSSSSSEEEEADILDELQDPEFLQVLSHLRNGRGPDGSLAIVSKEEQSGGKRKRERPFFLKDISQSLMGDRGGEDSTEEDNAQQQHRKLQQKPYAQELEGFRRELIKAAAEATQGGERGELFNSAHPEDVSAGKAQVEGTVRHHMQERLDELFGRDEDLSNEDLYLKRFVGNKGEAEQSGRIRLAVAQEHSDLDEDERHLEAAEEFEARHNFRFEEPGAGTVKTYPRNVEGVIRQADGARAEARARRKQRKQEERATMGAEVQRMKTLKRREIQHRMQELQSSSGLANVSKKLQEFLMSDTFDEQEYDRAMQESFNEAYYQEPDSDIQDGSDGNVVEDEDNYGGGHAVPASGFKAIKHQQPALATTQRDARTVQKLLQEYNSLEYEDIVAGLPTKFHYRQVEGIDYGLSTADILTLSDKDLNQLVGLKKYAPYREEAKSKRAKRDTLHKLGNLKKLQQVKGTFNGPVETVSAKPSAIKPADRRRSTYAIPQLKQTSAKGLSQAVHQQDAESVENESSLTKAQKRNMRRSKKRQMSSKTS